MLLQDIPMQFRQLVRWRQHFCRFLGAEQLKINFFNLTQSSSDVCITTRTQLLLYKRAIKYHEPKREQLQTIIEFWDAGLFWTNINVIKDITNVTHNYLSAFSEASNSLLVPMSRDIHYNLRIFFTLNQKKLGKSSYRINSLLNCAFLDYEDSSKSCLPIELLPTHISFSVLIGL